MTVEEFHNTEEYKNEIRTLRDSVRKNCKKWNCNECLLEYFCTEIKEIGGKVNE